MKALGITAATLLFVASALARDPLPSRKFDGVWLDSRQLDEAEADTPKLEYPKEARQRRIYGSGSFRLFVSTSSGNVQKVEIDQSTGSAILDTAAINGFTRWRYKPDVLRALQKRYSRGKKPEMVVIVIPITFRP
jgi:TonB family protein